MKLTILIFSLTLVLSGCGHLGNEEDIQNDGESFGDSSIDCRMKDFSVDYLQGLADGGQVDLQINQEYVDWLNAKPLCIDFCKKQLSYSDEYEDWFAENDLREVCESMGIVLPKSHL